jgi:hypothetical protein
LEVLCQAVSIVGIEMVIGVPTYGKPLRGNNVTLSLQLEINREPKRNRCLIRWSERAVDTLEEPYLLHRK